MKFADIEEAFMLVSHGMYGDHSAMICRSTGRICWSSESGEMDESPEEAYKFTLYLGGTTISMVGESRSPSVVYFG